MKSNWLTNKLGEVCELYQPKTISSKEMVKNGKYLVYGANGVIGKFDKYNHEESQLLITCRGATCGAVNISAPKSWINGNAMVVRPKKEALDIRFVEYLFRGGIDISKCITGAAQPQITRQTLSPIKINFPKALTEQQRIVSILDEAFSAIAKAKANAEKNLQNARELFESYLQSVFTNPGLDWVNVQLSELLDKGWIISHLDGNHGGEYPRKEEFISKGVPYISANCLKGTFVDLSLAKYLSSERAGVIRKGVALNNDVLFAHNATVGPVAILRTNEDKVILGTSLTYYRCNTEYILPEYLVNYMRSKEFKNQYELIMRQSTRNQVPITKQREFYHIIPPIEFQKTLVVKLEALLEHTQKLKTIYKLKLNYLEDLKKSILQKAFNGELKTTVEELV